MPQLASLTLTSAGERAGYCDRSGVAGVWTAAPDASLLDILLEITASTVFPLTARALESGCTVEAGYIRFMYFAYTRR